MRVLLRTFFCVLCACIGCGQAHAQSQKYWNHITYQDGLAGVTVTDIAGDRNGLTWLATSNGISLFNGRSLVNYPLSKNADGAPSHTYQIDLDAEGNVYASTKGGLFVLHRYENDFQRLVPEVREVECTLPTEHGVFCGNFQGLFRIDKNGKAVFLSLPYSKLDADVSVRDIKRLQDGRIVFLTRDAVNWLDSKTGKITYQMLRLPTGFSHLAVWKDRLFLGTKNHGLYVYDSKSRQARKLDGVKGNVISCLNVTAAGRVYVGCDGDGGYVVDAASARVLEHYGTSETDRHHLPYDCLYSFYCDREGHLWAGLFSKGMLYTYDNLPLFHHYACEGLDDAVDAFAVYADKAEKIITTNGGFYAIDEKSRACRFFDTKPLGCNVLGSVERWGDRFVIGSYDNGLLTCRPAAGQLERLKADGPLAYAGVNSLATDSQGRLFVASQDGLFIVEANGTIKYFNEQNSNLKKLPHNIVFDKSGYGWIGTSYGLCIYNPRNGSFANNVFPAGFFDKYRSLKFARGHGELLLASYQTNLFYTDSRMRHFGRIEIPDGLLDEFCKYLIDDFQGHYWLLTEKGLFSLSYDFSACQHYGQESGLSDATINTISIGRDGLLWVCTSAGVYSLNPQRVKTAARIAGTILPDIVFIGGTPIDRGARVRLTDERRLSLSWNIVSSELVFRPLVSGYHQTDGMMYEYRVDNGAWTILVPGQAIMLKRLSLGSHEVEMRCSGNPQTATTYTLAVLPSPLAYVELLLLLAALSLFLWWRRYRKQTKALLAEHAETEQALIDERRNQEKADEPTADEPEAKEKYQKSHLPERELRKIADTLERYMDNQKPFTNADLRMSDVATAIGVTPTQLSQVFTLHLQESYYDYVNRHRLQQFKQLITGGAHRQFTIAALSEQCGFKKTAFFSTFRRLEGMTPTEYIKRVKS